MIPVDLNHPAGLFPPPSDSFFEEYHKKFSGSRAGTTGWRSYSDVMSFSAGRGDYYFFRDGIEPKLYFDHVEQMWGVKPRSDVPKVYYNGSEPISLMVWTIDLVVEGELNPFQTTLALQGQEFGYHKVTSPFSIRVATMKKKITATLTPCSPAWN